MAYLSTVFTKQSSYVGVGAPLHTAIRKKYTVYTGQDNAAVIESTRRKMELSTWSTTIEKKNIILTKKVNSAQIIRKEKHLYVMVRRGNGGAVLTKIGISDNPRRRIIEANGIGYTKKKNQVFELFAVFGVGNTSVARMIESEVCAKFPVWTGRELLNVSPIKVFNYCKKRTAELGYPETIIWKKKA